MKADDIERAHGPQQFSGARQHMQQRRRNKWGMQEKPNAIAHTQQPEFLGQQEQVIVVHPDQIVFTQQLGQRLGKTTVDRAVALVVLPPELHEPEPKMQQRPQRAIGEIDVEGAVFCLGQVDRGVGRALGPLQADFPVSRAGAPAAPAEPDRSRGQCIRKCNG